MSVVEFDEAELSLRPFMDEPPARILARVCVQYSISVSELLGPEKLGHLVQARFAAYWLLRQRGYSYPSIGRYVGHRDHTTVMAGLRKVEARRAKDPDYALSLERLMGGRAA